MLPRVLKNFNVYVDGFGWAGRMDTITLPALNLVTEDHRAGGMDAPVGIEMGMEKLTMSMVTADFDPTILAMLGRKDVPITARGAVQRQGANVEPLIINMRGGWTGLEFGQWALGSKVQNTMNADLDYLRIRQNDVEYCEIDVTNMVRRINGVDQLAQQRAAIGI